MYNIDTKKWASYWETSRRTVQNWLKAEYPVTEKQPMAELIIEKSLGGLKCREKAERILLERDGRSPSENDAFENLSSLGKGKGLLEPGIDEVVEEGVDMRAASAWFWSKVVASSKLNDRAAVSYWQDRYLKNEKAIRDAEVHARKMGVDEGEVITREVFSKWSYALAFALVRSVEVDQRGLVQQIAKDELEMATLYEPVERFLMRSRFLKAFSSSVERMSGVSLPRWFFEEISKGVEAFFECDRSDADDVEAWERYQAVLGKRLEGASHA